MEVTVFHTTNCAFCKVEMEWLDSKKVKYDHYDIEKDDGAREYLEETWHQRAVPFTIIVTGQPGGIIINTVKGFDRKKLTEYLGLDK